MKSIIEQGSSIEKAIKSAWEKAEKPKEFSIKIKEEPTYNFIGMNNSPAVIAFFFDLPESLEQKATICTSQDNKVNSVRSVSTQQSKEQHKQKSVMSVESKTVSQTNDVGTVREIWTESMISMANTWLQDVFDSLEQGTIIFKSVAAQYDLKVTITTPIFEQVERQQQLYRGLSLLLMQTLRHNLHRPLRGFRVIITTL